MTGLIMKDLLVMRKALKSYLLIMAFYAVLAYFGILNFGFIITFVQIMLMVLPLSAFAYDDQTKWNRYAMSLPIGRRAVVAARYLFVLTLALFGVALGLAGSSFLWAFQSEEPMEMLLTLMVSATLGLLVSAAVLPVSYKVGVEQARIVLYAILLIPFIGLLLLAKANVIDFDALNRLNVLSPAALLGGASLLPLGGLAVLFISYLISCRIAAGKEY